MVVPDPPEFLKAAFAHFLGSVFAHLATEGVDSAFGRLQAEWRSELVQQDDEKTARSLEDFFSRKAVLTEAEKVRDDRLDQVDFERLDTELRESFQWAQSPALNAYRAHLRRWWRDLESLVQPDRIKTHERYRKQYLRKVYKAHGFITFTGFAEVTGLREVELARIFEMPRVLRKAEAREQERRAEAKPVSASRLIQSAEEQRAVVLGKPGAGKTTLLECFAFATAAHALAAEAKVPSGFEWAKGIAQLPVFYRIRDLAQDRRVREPLRSCLYRSAAQWLELDSPPPGFFEREADTNGLLVLLDGLDEAGSPARRNELAGQIGLFSAGLLGSSTLIVSSRPHDYEQRRLDPSSFAHYELQDFDEKQIQRLIHRSSVAYMRNPRKAKEKEERLTAALARRKDLRELAGNALLLAMIVRVHFGLGMLPDSRLDLYAKCEETLLKLWSDEKGLGKSPLEASVKHDFLAELAFELQCEAGDSLDPEFALHIQRRDLTKRLRQFLKDECPEAVSRVDKIVDRFHKRDAILVTDGSDGFSFMHRSLQEYFAACWLNEGLQQHEFDEKVANEPPGWNETLYLAVAGIQNGRRREEVLLGLLKRSQVEFARSAMSAAKRPKPWLETLILFLARYYGDGAGPAVKDCAKLCGGTAETIEALKGIFYPEDVQRRDGRALASGVELARELTNAGNQEAGKLLDDFFAESRKDGLNTKDKMADCDGVHMDRYLVTNRDYERMIPGHERCDVSSEDDQPVVNVNWWEAKLYAEWCGARLPSEDQWYKAASLGPGVTKNRIYPWGDEWNPRLANTREDGPRKTTPVGTYADGKSAYGCYDMAGNVWEWTADYDADRWMWVRGGSWNGDHGSAACAVRDNYLPGFRNYYLGFRCART